MELPIPTGYKGAVLEPNILSLCVEESFDEPISQPELAHLFSVCMCTLFVGVVLKLSGPDFPLSHQVYSGLLVYQRLAS